MTIDGMDREERRELQNFVNRFYSEMAEKIAEMVAMSEFCTCESRTGTHLPIGADRLFCDWCAKPIAGEAGDIGRDR